MAQGLEVFDETGRKIMDSKTHVSFVLGIHFIMSKEGSLTNPKFSEGTPFAYFPGARTSMNAFGFSITYKFTGNVLSWKVPEEVVGTIRLVYGIIT